MEWVVQVVFVIIVLDLVILHLRMESLNESKGGGLRSSEIILMGDNKPYIGEYCKYRKVGQSWSKGGELLIVRENHHEWIKFKKIADEEAEEVKTVAQLIKLVKEKLDKKG